MTLNKKDDFGKTIGIWASIATIIGTCIAVIALVPAFGQWISPKEQSAIPQPTFTPVINFYPTQTEEVFIAPTNGDLATNTPEPAITPTNIPVEPKTIEQTDIYTIIIRSPNAEEHSGGLKVRLYAGNEPTAAKMQVFNAMKDVTDKWVPTRGDDGMGWFGNYEEDMFSNPEPLELTSGMYVLTAPYIVGHWGNEYLYGENTGEQHYLTFPVEEGLVTEITLRLALLEIGILTRDNQPANGVQLNIECLSNEYGLTTGKVSCGYQYEQTNAGGLASYVIAAGNYTVNVFWVGEFEFDEKINVTSTDKNRVVFTAP